MTTEKGECRVSPAAWARGRQQVDWRIADPRDMIPEKLRGVRDQIAVFEATP